MTSLVLLVGMVLSATIAAAVTYFIGRPRSPTVKLHRAAEQVHAAVDEVIEARRHRESQVAAAVEAEERRATETRAADPVDVANALIRGD